MMFGVKSALRNVYRRWAWRGGNAHNGTILGVDGSPFFKGIVTVGDYTYGILNVFAHNDQAELRIGCWCSIAPDVSFVLNNEHVVDSLSTYPFRAKVLGEYPEAGTKGGITVGDDVWIGYRATILDGVTIGQGAIVAAGAVVAKEVPPYAVVGGVPAKVIRYRYPEDVVELMKRVDWSLVDEEFVRGHIDLLYKHPATRDDALELLAEIERHIREDK